MILSRRYSTVLRISLRIELNYVVSLIYTTTYMQRKKHADIMYKIIKTVSRSSLAFHTFYYFVCEVCYLSNILHYVYRRRRVVSYPSMKYL